MALTSSPVSNVSGASGVTDHSPPGSLAVVVYTTPPIVTSISLPGSAVPLTSEPFAVSISGAAGAVASTVSVAGSEVLPFSLVAVTLTSSPVSNVSGASGVTDHSPPGSLAVVVYTTPPIVTSISLPGSAVPLTSEPFAVSISGDTGALTTWASTGELCDPFSSTDIAVTIDPSASEATGVTNQFPDSSTIVNKSDTPSPSVSI